MAKKITASSEGDRRDLSGKLPQFDGFAYFAYEALRRGDLSWIRVADPEALKLDDIQYATATKIHAYQVKWSIQSPPEPFSFTEFKNLIPELAAGYTKLKAEYRGEGKELIIHLLSNRSPSLHDRVGTPAVGTFSGFQSEVWEKIKSRQSVAPKWQPIVTAIKESTALNDQEFDEFVRAFEINLDFSPESFGVKINSKRSDDLQRLSRFLFETVASREKKVLFPKKKLVEELGWSYRFETIFTYELIVDPSRYFPITATIQGLESIINKTTQGYVFLEGGPGTGKSTLLTQWANEKEEVVIKYYAFDFTNPNSIENTPRRAEAVTLFHDLVLQLHESGALMPDTLIQKDIDFLTKALSKQLEQLSGKYISTRKKTFILIDGLDHLPREYKQVVKSFLSYLPSPAALPNGVVIILGSQTFELEDLKQDIKDSWHKGDRNVKMVGITREDVLEYIEKSEIKIPMTSLEKEKVISTSQGHPLYLSYLVNKIKHADDLSFLEDTVPFDGDIERYYGKEWEMILGKEAVLIDVLGLVSRIEGDVLIDFIREWGFLDHVLRSFRKNCIHFFQESGNPRTISFFHNSFRQFLIVETAKDPLDNQFNEGRDQNYHRVLAEKYAASSKEPLWKELYHAFFSGAYERFLSKGTPEAFSTQFVEFRPVGEIKRDILFGMEIAKRKNDPYLLFRYVIALSEIERRSEYVNPGSFVLEFMELGETALAKRLLRNQSGLLVSKETAMKAAALFEEMDDPIEAKLLFSLSIPEEITKKAILIPSGHESHATTNKIKKWVGLAARYMSVDELIEKIKSVRFKKEQETDDNRNIRDLHEVLMFKAGRSLRKLQRWPDFENILAELKQGEPIDRFTYGKSLIDAARFCHGIGDFEKSREWLKTLLADLSFFNNPAYRLAIADLVFMIEKNVEKVKELIDGIPQPEIVEVDEIEHSLGPFLERITLNRLLNLIGKRRTVLEAVPENPKKNPAVIEFERKLFMITAISTDAKLQVPLAGKIIAITKPILEFYYSPKKYDLTWSKLRNLQKDYFNFLISAIAGHGLEKLNELMDAFFEAFEHYPEYWSAELRRSILLSAKDHGYFPTEVESRISSLEEHMLKDHDITSKVDECSSQAKALLEVGQKKAALAQIKEALRQSEGIGYSKDYQLNVWSEWMRKVNTIDRIGAKKRISWFLSHLDSVSQSVEGHTFYLFIRKILQVTIEFDGGWGITLAIWLLEKGYCTVAVVLEEYLHAQVARISNVADIKFLNSTYCYLYLFIVKEPSTSLLRDLLQAGHSRSGTLFVTADLPPITTAIMTIAAEESRTNLLVEVEEFLETNGLDVPDEVSGSLPGKAKRKNKSSASELRLLPPSSGGSLSEEEVLKRVVNFRDFLSLYRREDKVNSYFNWNMIINKIGNSFTIDNIQELFHEITTENSRASVLLSSLAHYAHKLGDATLASAIVEKALESSSSSGWQRHYDGGTRLLAFRALQEINPENGYKRALTVFSDDIIQKGSSRMEFEEADEVLPVITQMPNTLLFWNEVENYLHRLMATSASIKDLPDFDKEASKNGLDTLLAFVGNLSAKEPRDRARRLLVEGMTQGGVLSSVILTTAEKPYRQRYWTIDMISLLNQVNRSVVSDFMIQLQELINDEDLSTRLQARKILSGVTGENIFPIKIRPLSPIYEMKFSGSSPTRPSNPIGMFDTVKDTEDIKILLGPFKDQIDFLSVCTGLSEGSISQRILQIIHEKGPSEKLSSSYEKKTAEYLKEIDLHYPFHRPRFEVIDHAIRTAAAELVDAGKLNLDKEVQSFYCRHDYFADIYIPFCKKPRFIEPILPKGRTALPKNWVSDVKSSDRFHQQTFEVIDDWFVIGEYSIRRGGSYQVPQETYRTHVLTGGQRDPHLEDRGFAFVYRQLMDSHYDDCHCPSEPYLVLINKNDFDNSGLRPDWLAFNPVIAENLGWQPSDIMPLAWENKEGRLVARSSFWVNGNLWMDARESTASTGWIVTISSAGMQQLKERYKLFVSKSATRETRYDRNHETKEHAAFFRVPD